MNTVKAINRAAIPLIFGLATMLSATAQAEDPYQYKVLFTPSENILRAEALGRIMIYDGLTNEEVERAMTEQYDRIENMMFVRTRQPDPEGGYVVEDDGCD